MKNISINGVLDTRHYGNIKDRSWAFRTIGYGHSEKDWKNIISALRMVGYDYVLFKIEIGSCTSISAHISTSSRITFI